MNDHEAPMDLCIAVGFGMACVTKDGNLFFDGEKHYTETGKTIALAEIEQQAQKDPNADWRLIIMAPLHGETYHRQGENKWVCVESNKGFA